MASQVKVRELRFPNAGVNRRLGFRDSADIQTVRDDSGRKSQHATPWTVNCRPEDALLMRLRGGSRPGLTKYCSTNVGSVAAMAPLVRSTGSGTQWRIAVLAGGSLQLLSHAAGVGTAVPIAYDLSSESGVTLQTESGQDLYADTAAAPGSTTRLIVRNHSVYCVRSSGVSFLDTATGFHRTLLPTSGSVPTGCTFGCFYRDRLVLAGADNAIYLSRQGDPTDWNYGADANDPGRAMVFQLSGSGEIGDRATALIPCGDGHLLAATASTLWMIEGDPAAGGSLRPIDKNVGIVGDTAWCRAGGSVYFVAANDLYRIHATGQGMENLTKDCLPGELRGLDQSRATVSLVYDHDAKGLYVFQTGGSVDEHWFFDLNYHGFWPIAYAPGHEPVAACEVDGKPVLVCSDGYLRVPGGSDDDGTPIDSHVLIGPVPLAGPTRFGRLVKLSGALGETSGDCIWSICLGDTAETAVETAKRAVLLYASGDVAGAAALVHSSGTFSAGRNHVVYPRARGAWMAIWLRAIEPWAYEGITIETMDSGSWR